MKKIKEKNKQKEKRRGKNINWTMVSLSVALLIVVLAGTIMTIGLKSKFEEKIAKEKEEARPAQIELMVIKDPNCGDCFNIDTIVQDVKKKNVNITKSTEFTVQKSQETIKKYGIDKVPAVIITGETNKISIKDFSDKNGALIYTGILPPFTDPNTMEIKGEVDAILIKSNDCDKCVDLEPLIEQFNKSGVTIKSETILDHQDLKARDLIDKLSIKTLPSIILSDEIKAYGEEFITTIEKIGFKKEKDSYVSEVIRPPYLNLTTGKVKGLITITYLTDDSCTKCYDAESFHKPILKGLGVTFDKEQRVDISSEEGKLLVKKYGIKKVPTIILTEDSKLYPNLMNAWAQVGTVENDETLVFRGMEVIGQVYQNLDTQEVVNPTRK